MVIRRLPVEVQFTALMISVLIAVSLYYRLPIRFPDLQGAQFVGIHYLYPFYGLLLCLSCAAWGGKGVPRWRVWTAFPCYAAVLFVHFHLKLWTPIIHPVSYDDAYWQVDQTLRPVVDFCFLCRKLILPIIPYEANLYMWGFIALFWSSIGYHAIFTPEKFRVLFLAMLFLQGLGALAYLIAPAAGPFLYEPGLNPHIGEAQRYMYAVHQIVATRGQSWLPDNETHVLLTGVGAMPSLHVASSVLFLWFATRYGRPLLPLYIPMTAFIVINSVASRWHYLVDLPAGIALAAFSIRMAYHYADQEQRAPLPKSPRALTSPDTPAFGLPCPGLR